MSTIVIRKSDRGDMKQVMAMIVDLAALEGYQDEVEITAEDLERDSFDMSHPRFVSYVAECTETGELVGYILGNFAYSSWAGHALHMEDFYVKPTVRGKLIGHKLFKEFCKLGRDNDCCRIKWTVLKENAVALKFYRGHGAYDICDREKRTCYHLPRDAILKVANAD